VRVWSGEATGKATIDRKQALLSGLSPIDAALAAAGQSGLKRIAPDLAMALEEYGRLHATAERRLPFRLDGIDRPAECRGRRGDRPPAAVERHRAAARRRLGGRRRAVANPRRCPFDATQKDRPKGRNR
jgi:hypothetical protein